MYISVFLHFFLAILLFLWTHEIGSSFLCNSFISFLVGNIHKILIDDFGLSAIQSFLYL